VIVFCCPDTARPSGGVRAIYRAVDLLNDAGLDAAVLHRRADFRCDWFVNATRVVHPPVEVGGDDVLVVPEAFTPGDVQRLPFGVPKVVFNQNAYRTFWSASRRDGVVDATTADHPDVAAVVAVSEHDRAMLERALPRVRVVRLHHWIDGDVFRAGADAREHRIVAMPRKRPHDFRLLADLLHARGVLDGDWELVTLEGRPEAEVADELGRAALFVALGRDEGFGLPVAEALACACPVVGFHGGGGRELFGRDGAVAVDDGDVAALADWIDGFVGAYDTAAGVWRQRGDDAAKWIRSTYTREQATDDLVTCFSSIPTRPEVASQGLRADDLPRPGVVDRVRTQVVRLGRRYTAWR
jgi:glycosyltransferase involved in cell wall biosynthesis